jgi:hypothetical protein
MSVHVEISIRVEIFFDPFEVFRATHYYDGIESLTRGQPPRLALPLPIW